MTSNNRRTALFLAAIVLLMALPARATISRAFTFDEKVEHAAAILVGKCVRQESRWDDSRRWILTYSTFQVEKLMKGSMALRELTIVTPGGQVGDLTQDTIGVPRFNEGDERVLFVKNTAAGPTVLYFDQGAYLVEKDDRGERVVRPVASEAMYVDTRGGQLVRAEQARTLREFEGAVRESVKRREAIRMEMLEEKRKQEEASLNNVVRRNFALIALALIGAVLATWQLVRRS